MKYEIRHGDYIVGKTELEGGDPPMGYVFGTLTPTQHYNKDLNQDKLKLYSDNALILCESIAIEDLSEEMGELSIDVTVLIQSSEEYEKYFKHHSEAYEAQFK